MRQPSQRTLRKKQLLRTLMHEIKSLRESKYQSSVDTRAGHCSGMIHAAYVLDAITGDEYDRLSELAINAAYYRRMEQEQAAYTWLVAPAKKVAA